MLKDYLPSIVTLIIGILTFGGSIAVSIFKRVGDDRTLKVNVEEQIREDLMKLIDHYEKQISERDAKLQSRDEEIEQSRKTTAAQLLEITELKLKVINLQYEVTQLRLELDKFNRKVYYVREEKPNES